MVILTKNKYHNMVLSSCFSVTHNVEDFLFNKTLQDQNIILLSKKATPYNIFLTE